jgi:hypothetical protein
MSSKYSISLLVVVAAAVIVFIGWYPRDKAVEITDTRTLKTFYNLQYGVAFNYPDSYEIKQYDSTEGTKHHTIVVGDKAALAAVPENSEGPAVITIDIYDNAARLSGEKWIKTSDFSNYKLSQEAQLSTTTVAGIPALSYPWDGLYRSISIVFPQKTYMYMLSVGYNSPDDQQYKDFAGIVSSIQFDP